MKSNRVETVAAINVGANFITMVIVQILPNGEYFVLEELEHFSNLGKESFITGRISSETIERVCDILSKYVKLMHKYKVKIYKAVSTGALREAENREYVIEQIRIFTGITVQIINSSQEYFFMYKALHERLKNIDDIYKESTMILNMGFNGVDITIYNEGSIIFTEYIKIETLEFYEMLPGFDLENLCCLQIMEQLVDSKLKHLEKITKSVNIKKIIGLGSELEVVLQMCHRNQNIRDNRLIHVDELRNMYKKTKSITIENIPKEFHIQNDNIHQLMLSSIILSSFFNMTDIDKIYIPSISLKQGLLIDIINDIKNNRRGVFTNIIMHFIKYIAQKYASDKDYYEYVENIAVSIFDQTIRIHKLGDKERLYLRIAALLHGVGKYITQINYQKHSFNIINSEHIIGLSDKEIDIVANIVRYHGDKKLNLSHNSYNFLSKEDRITVVKLVSILKLAKSLCILNKSKIEKLHISFNDRRLIFNIKVEGDISLERWNFKENSNFFKEVMGYGCVLEKIKSKY